MTVPAGGVCVVPWCGPVGRVESALSSGTVVRAGGADLASHYPQGA